MPNNPDVSSDSWHPTHEELAGFCLDTRDGEAGDNRVSEHLDQCPVCRAATAELTSTLETLSTNLRSAISPDWQQPASTLWVHVAETTFGDNDSQPRTAPVVPLGQRGQSRPASTRLLWLAGIAAALSVGVVVGHLGTRQNVDTTDSASVVATAQLQTLTDQESLGTARVDDVSGSLELVVPTDPIRSQNPPDAGGYYEVWLINDDLTRMVSVGVLRGQGNQRFPITHELLDAGYRTVDVSHELFDDQPEHSGDSVVRGTLT